MIVVDAGRHVTLQKARRDYTELVALRSRGKGTAVVLSHEWI